MLYVEGPPRPSQNTRKLTQSCMFFQNQPNCSKNLKLSISWSIIDVGAFNNKFHYIQIVFVMWQLISSLTKKFSNLAIGQFSLLFFTRRFNRINPFLEYCNLYCFSSRNRHYCQNVLLYDNKVRKHVCLLTIKKENKSIKPYFEKWEHKWSDGKHKKMVVT
jgi:hypothetical protein